MRRNSERRPGATRQDAPRTRTQTGATKTWTEEKLGAGILTPNSAEHDQNAKACLDDAPVVAAGNSKERQPERGNAPRTDRTERLCTSPNVSAALRRGHTRWAVRAEKRAHQLVVSESRNLSAALKARLKLVEVLRGRLHWDPKCQREQCVRMLEGVCRGRACVARGKGVREKTKRKGRRTWGQCTNQTP